MQYFDVAISFAAILALCVFFTKKCRINSALTPLLAVSCVILWFSAAGVADILRPAGYVFFGVAFALFVYAIVPQKKAAGTAQKAEATLLTPGFLFFIIISVFFIIYFAVRKPIFSEWDELSLWGTACKMMKLEDRLYTTAEVAWNWIPSQLPGLISLGYYMQFFGAVFAPWKVFIGYDILFFAVYSAAVAAFPKFKQYGIFVPVAVISVLTPYLLTVYTRIVFASNIYMSSYGDIPSGMMFGGVLAWYFSYKYLNGDENLSNDKNGFWAIFVIISAASLMKDNTFVIQLVAAGIIAADMLFFGTAKKAKTKKAEAAHRIFAALGAVVCPAAMYIIWNRYIVSIVAVKEEAGELGQTSLPLSVVVKKGFAMLLGFEERSARFTDALNQMIEGFIKTKLCVFGSGAVIALVIIAIFVVAAVLGKDAAHRRRTVLTAVLSTLGFVGYYWVLILSYAFIFRESQAARLDSYNRYVNSYYLGWFLIAVVMLAISAAKPKSFVLLRGALLGLCAVAILCVARYVRPEMSVIAYPESTFYSWKQMQDEADTAKQAIEKLEKGKVFFVSQNDNGLRFFTICYEMLPYQMDLSFGGGRTGPEEYNDGSLYYHDSFVSTQNGKTEKVNLDLQGLKRYLNENDCEYIMIDELDELFEQQYADLFTDKLLSAKNGDALMYKRVVYDNGEVLYEPILQQAVLK